MTKRSIPRNRALAPLLHVTATPTVAKMTISMSTSSIKMRLRFKKQIVKNRQGDRKKNC